MVVNCSKRVRVRTERVPLLLSTDPLRAVRFCRVTVFAPELSKPPEMVRALLEEATAVPTLVYVPLAMRISSPSLAASMAACKFGYGVGLAQGVPVPMGAPTQRMDVVGDNLPGMLNAEC